ncbi:MAG: acyl-CoA dehydrogenase family protein, partial [Gammaproteobacteria bacterium]|nr:acyl-CoA dehydrogenase family protein [Gammaproteobacteria bacterium]
MALVEIILLLFLVFATLYMRAPIIVWTIALGIALILVTLSARLGAGFLLISWFFYLLAVLFISLKPFRIRYFTHPLTKFLQKRMPPISNAEREAIEAGDVWWEKDLFCGRPPWKKLLTQPQPALTSEEQSFLNNEVNTLCQMINDWQIVNNDCNLPDVVWNYLKEKKFFGLVIPKEYGGHGFSALAHSSIVMKLATRSLSVAV